MLNNSHQTEAKQTGLWNSYPSGPKQKRIINVNNYRQRVLETENGSVNRCGNTFLAKLAKLVWPGLWSGLGHPSTLRSCLRWNAFINLIVKKSCWNWAKHFRYSWAVLFWLSEVLAGHEVVCKGRLGARQRPEATVLWLSAPWPPPQSTDVRPRKTGAVTRHTRLWTARKVVKLQ